MKAFAYQRADSTAQAAAASVSIGRLHAAPAGDAPVHLLDAVGEHGEARAGSSGRGLLAPPRAEGVVLEQPRRLGRRELGLELASGRSRATPRCLK